MTIIVFLIDTSASMNQRACLGGRPTLLDVAKGAVETFVKIRQRSPESRLDRYMLLTFEDPPNNIKAGWKENIGIFMNELKNLSCVGLTTLGAALKHAFDILNINRMQTGIDTYGQGRCPFFLEPSVIVVITDGGKLSTVTGVQEDFNLPMHAPIPGSELTREPFRWDQRLFSLVLRLSGTPAMDRDTGLVPSDTSPIDAMCEVTGGRSYCITSQRMLLQCVDSLVLKVQSGVVINLEKIGPDPPPAMLGNPGDGRGDGDGEDAERDPNDVDGARSNQQNSAGTAWHNCRRLIYVPRNGQKGYAVGFWPIPESFWPDTNATSLPPRSAHPNMKFTCTSQEPMVIENLPFDKYELEPSPLTQYILARKQPTVCWQVFVPNSYKNSDVGHPFGYLKASTNLSCVNLFVMPYNYPALLPLLDELFKVHRSKPTPEWRTQFQNYLRTMPAYYAVPLRRALTRMGSPGNLPQTLIPESMDTSLNYGVLNYLKRLKTQAKTEHDKICNEVSNRGSNKIIQGNEGVRVIPRSPLKKDLVSHPLLQDKFNNLRDQLSDFGGFQAGLDRGTTVHGVHNYRNAFDTPRRALLDQVVRMRANFLQTNLGHTKVVDEDWKHSMPVCQMGNYQEHLKRMPAQLREIESVPVRQHMFGNPFKIDKSMMVDEADMDMVAGSGGGGGSSPRSSSKRAQPGRSGLASGIDGRGPPNKRKPGPIPRDMLVRRPQSPRPGTPILTSGLTPPASPAPPTPPASPGPQLAALSGTPASNLPGTPGVSGVTAVISIPGLPVIPGLAGISSIPGIPGVPGVPVVAGIPGSPGASPVTPGSQPGSPVINVQTALPGAQPGVQQGVLAGVSPGVQPMNLLGLQTNSQQGGLTGAQLGNPGGIPGGPVAAAAAVAAPTAPVPVTAATADSGVAAPPEPTPMDVDVALAENSNVGHTNGPMSLDAQLLIVKDECSRPFASPSCGDLAIFGDAAAAFPGAAATGDAATNADSRLNSQTMKRELAKITRHNLNVRALAYKEVRRPGKNFSLLLENLQSLRGGPEIRAAVLQQIIEESLRFKRRTLATLVQQVLSSVEASANSSSAGVATGLVNNNHSGAS